jgi:hypothetical protein
MHIARYESTSDTIRKLKELGTNTTWRYNLNNLVKEEAEGVTGRVLEGIPAFPLC